MLPDPVIDQHNGIYVVREDLIPGGTKRRAIASLFTDNQHEYVYPSPVWGYAQVALAHAAQDHDKHATIFCAAHAVRKPLTLEAARLGAGIHEQRPGYMSVVRARAREYCHREGAQLLPFGLDDPRFIEALAAVARALPIVPAEVWSVAGSGVLTRALQMAWPDAAVHAVRIGAEPNAGRATVYEAPERYEDNARTPPPFPSCGNYDAKAWQFILKHASPGALFWNL